MSTKEKTSYWIMILFILAGLIIGSILGKLAANIPSLAFFSYGEQIGLETVTLDLGVATLIFGFTIYINIASFLGIIIGLLLYKWLIR